MKLQKFYFLISLFFLCSIALPSSSDEDGIDSEEYSEKITPEQVMYYLRSILTKQEMGIIAANHSKVLSSSSRGIFNYFAKNLEIQLFTRQSHPPIPLIFKNRFDLSNENIGLEIFSEDEENISRPEEIAFRNQAIQHPAISENDISELIQTLACDDKIKDNLLKIILAQKSGTIHCIPSLHAIGFNIPRHDQLHIFIDQNPTTRTIFHVENTSDYPRIKAFIIHAITEVLNKRNIGRIKSSNGLLYEKDGKFWQKKIEIDYEDNAGFKYPLCIKTQQARSSRNRNALEYTNQPLIHDAYPSEEELQQITENTNLAKTTRESVLTFLSSKFSGTIICARDIYDKLFLTAQIEEIE
ncbi:hypothetical protein KBB68_00335 [Candidatus Babeliales bacterium]|nr:hypothetical protein [Candidatus Babeliales bacterium]